MGEVRLVGTQQARRTLGTRLLAPICPLGPGQHLQLVLLRARPGQPRPPAFPTLPYLQPRLLPGSSPLSCELKPLGTPFPMGPLLGPTGQHRRLSRQLGR